MKVFLILFSLLTSIHGFSQSGTLVVLNKSDDTASLIDLETKQSVATLPTGKGPHEVAVSPNGQFAVVTNYGHRSWSGSSLTLIDIAYKKVTKTMALKSKAPHGIEFISENQVLVTCEESKKLIQVNILSGFTEKSINTEQETSHMVVYSADQERAFVANISSNSVSVINLKSNVLEKIIKTGDGAEGIALSADGSSVWVTNRGNNTISIIDCATLEITRELNSEKFPIRVKTTSDGKYALVSNAQTGTVNIFDASSKNLLKTISMEVSALEKKTSRLFQDFDNSPVPVGILIHPDNSYAFVANTNADIITIINLESLEISGRLSAGNEPDGLGFSPIKLN